LPKKFGEVEKAIISTYRITLEKAYAEGGIELLTKLVRDLSRITGRRTKDMLKSVNFVILNTVDAQPLKRQKTREDQSPDVRMSLRDVLRYFKAKLLAELPTEEELAAHPVKLQGQTLKPHLFMKETIELYSLKSVLFKTRSRDQVKIYYQNTTDGLVPGGSQPFLLSNRFRSSREVAKGCDCEGNCIENRSCRCCVSVLQRHPAVPIVALGSTKVLLPTHPAVIEECSSLCKCSPITCGMSLALRPEARPQRQLFLSRRTAAKKRRRAAKKWGVKTALEIPENAFICEMTGVVTEEQQIVQVAMQGAQLLYLNTKEGCSLAGFIGLSDQGNIECIRVKAVDFTPEKTKVCLFSTKLINAGEELLIVLSSLGIYPWTHQARCQS
jgi:hypothetical protein